MIDDEKALKKETSSEKSVNAKSLREKLVDLYLEESRMNHSEVVRLLKCPLSVAMVTGRLL